jgi:hypothetical protein
MNCFGIVDMIGLQGWKTETCHLFPNAVRNLEHCYDLHSHGNR